VSPDEARARFAAARSARLATVGEDGAPHVVPICFALAGDGTLYTAVDHKPKRTANLRRLRNIAVNPNVSVLADHYEDEDWSRLWWARADGTARVLEPGHPGAIALLQARYEPYRTRPPEGPVIAVAVARWSGWSGGDIRT
jgi:PPOX class probable F420-dependent enzyme